jgi:hypothetical protein
MVTYRVWVENAGRGDDYYYSFRNKRDAGRMAIKLNKKGRLNSVVQNTRRGERQLSTKEHKSIVKAARRRIKRTNNNFGIRVPNFKFRY